MTISEIDDRLGSVYFEPKSLFGNSTVSKNYTKVGKSMLNSAIQSVERQFKVSQSVKEQAEQEHLDAEFLRNLNEVENIERLEQADNTDQLDVSSQEDLAELSETPEPEHVSARLLDLKNKQNSSQKVQASMAQGVDVLKSMAERASHMTDYLQKLEIDIERLENVEAHSEKLKIAAGKLAQDHREQSKQNNELKQSLDQFKIQNDNVLGELQSARIEVDRVKHENQRLENFSTSQKASIVKLENDKLVLNERLELWEQAHGKIDAKLKEALAQIVKQTAEIKKKEKKIAHQQTKLLEADNLVEQHRIELAEVRTNFEHANTSSIETKFKLNETLAQHEVEINESNAKLALQQKRIAELETQNHVLNRQVAINEDLIASLDHQLHGGAEKPPTPQQEHSDTVSMASRKKAAVDDQKRCENVSAH